MAITVIRHGITLDELDAWGSVADLGSEILEGEVKAFGKMTAGAPTDPVSAAYFGTTAGKFRMTYPFSEQATVVSGEVRLTDESTGQSTLYKAGDSWFVSKGTPVLWEVADGGFVKHYYAVVGGWFFWRGGAGGVGWLEARRGAGLGVFDRLAYTNRRMVWIARFQPDSEYLLALDRAGMRSQ